MSARWVLISGTLLLSAVTPRLVHAQGQESTWAQSLFEEGRQLRKERKFAEACEKFAKSQALGPAVGTLLNLGECNEQLGRLASAWGSYKQAAALARVKNDPSREARAAASAALLEPRLSRLTIRIQRRQQGLVVKRGEETIPESAWDSPLPVDEGTYSIVVSAQDFRPFTTSVDVPRTHGAIVVDVPPLTEEKAVVKTPAPAPAVPAAALPAQGPPAAAEGGSRAPAIVALSAGAVGLGVGAYFLVRARGRWDDARGGCDSANRCEDASYELAKSARRDGDIATVAVVVGLVGVATGALLWFALAPSSSKRALWLVPTATRVSLEGTF